MTNVILLLLDALRHDYVTPEITPNLVEIARDGVSYSFALAGNTSTIKSLPCMLSADFNYSSEDNIANVLREEGYTTAAFHSSPLVGRHFSGGFDVFEDLHHQKGLRDRKVRRLARKYIPRPLFDKIKTIYRRYTDVDKFLPYTRAPDVLEIAWDWMKEAPQPYFLWIHLMDPHLPYYPVDDLGMSREEMIEINDKLVNAAYRRDRLADEEVDLLKKLYRTEVSEMDEAVGAFYEKLGDEILIISSDHGEEFGEYGDFSHHEDKFVPCLQRVPLIMCGEGLGRGIRKGDFSHLNLAPTIFELLGVDRRIGIWKRLKADAGMYSPTAERPTEVRENGEG